MVQWKIYTNFTSSKTTMQSFCQRTQICQNLPVKCLFINHSFETLWLNDKYSNFVRYCFAFPDCDLGVFWLMSESEGIKRPSHFVTLAKDWQPQKKSSHHSIKQILFGQSRYIWNVNKLEFTHPPSTPIMASKPYRLFVKRN